MGRKILLWSVGVLAGLYFLFMGLSQAKGFLVPVSFGIFLAVLLYPVSVRLETWGMSRGLASFATTLIILLTLVGIFFLISKPISNFAEDWPQIEEKIKPRIERIQQYISVKTGIAPYKQEEKVKDKLTETISETGSNIFTKTMSIFGSLLLVMVYTFFFQYTRRRFKSFVLKLVPDDQNEKTKDMIGEAGKIAGSYLFGKMILIIILAVLYSIGFLIIGIQYPILIALVAALLSIVPYVGNMTGGMIAIILAILTNGGWGPVIGVVVVFGFAQFLESYILEPLIVGNRVDLNPVFTIIAVILGGSVWGIPGMILSIPFLGILKVIFDNVDDLKPFGYLVGKEKEEGASSDKFNQLKIWLKEKFNH